MNFRRHPKTLLAAAILAATGAPQVAFTQDSGADIEEVVVTGARGRPRPRRPRPPPGRGPAPQLEPSWQSPFLRPA